MAARAAARRASGQPASMLYVPRHRLPAVAIVLWPELHAPLLLSAQAPVLPVPGP